MALLPPFPANAASESGKGGWGVRSGRIGGVLAGEELAEAGVGLALVDRLALDDDRLDPGLCGQGIAAQEEEVGVLADVQAAHAIRHAEYLRRREGDGAQGIRARNAIGDGGRCLVPVGAGRERAGLRLERILYARLLE